MAVADRRLDPSRRPRIDWALASVGLIALALLAGAVIRTGAPGLDREFGRTMGGIRALSDTETLVLFEDGTSTTAPWSTGRPDSSATALGAIWLADPPDAPLERSIALPPGTIRVILSLDFITIDGWSGQGVSLALDGVEVLRQRFPTDPGHALPPAETRLAGIRLRPSAARELGFATGGPDLAERILSLDIVTQTRGDTLLLTITPLPADPPAPGAAPPWAIDNLLLVAERS
jgi:hypothetical protein